MFGLVIPADKLRRNSGNQHRSCHTGGGRYPEIINSPGYGVALRLHGSRDLKGYRKKGNCDTVCFAKVTIARETGHALTGVLIKLIETKDGFQYIETAHENRISSQMDMSITTIFLRRTFGE